MRIFTVHLGPRSGPLAPAGGRDLVVVKEGFCWPAAFFTVLWALWHRMWITAFALFVASAAIDGLVTYADFDAGLRFAIDVLVLVVIGQFANDWRRLELTRRGFEDAAVAAAPDVDAAELRAAERLGLDAPRLSSLGAAGL
ncbi:MAG: DUF2628 domain-containing protein [Alphaproteobacteria bacterium]